MKYAYSDGDRLSPDDQKFVTENVFEFHPDKQSKVSDQIDYIMVSQMNFQPYLYEALPVSIFYIFYTSFVEYCYCS